MQEAVYLTTISDYCLVAVFSFLAATIGGIAGYGTGLILPPILLPIVGAKAVVPIISLSALMTNASRLVAFRDEYSAQDALVVALCALPTCIAGAYLYTALSSDVVTVMIGLVLIILVPLRRYAEKVQWKLQRAGMALAGSGYGVFVGATTGSGVILLSILLAGGLRGSAVIATDAGISLFLGIIKSAVFQTAGVLPLSAWIMAVVIGCCATPGTFLAKRLVRHLPVHVHTGILDGVVILGGVLLIVQVLFH
jgi:uncharacterized protein